LKRKFFLIVFGFLTATIIVVSTLQQFYFASERLRLMDQRLETIASSLIASGLSLNLIENLESTDDLIHDLLGDERVDSIINIYSRDGKVLAQNYTASAIPLNFNATDRWQTYEVEGKKVHVLNLVREHLVIQVGLIVDPTLYRMDPVLNRYFVAFLIFVSLLLVVTAYVSSRLLFGPLKNLTLEMKSMSNQLDRSLGKSLSEFVIGPEFKRLTKYDKNSKDEFIQLCLQLEVFLNKLENYTRSFNAQAAILTHELKTPLTILKNCLEDLSREINSERAKQIGKNAGVEIDYLTNLINDYLQWSVLTSNPNKPIDLYAIHIVDTVKRLVMGLNSQNEQRITLKIEGSPTVFASPHHVDQLVGNLLNNAITYSPKDRPVECVVTETSLIVQDYGGGIPADVLGHLGQPFNRGTVRNSNMRSTGLGLAWVYALAEKYKWKLEVDATARGTRMSVTFP
jgi:signal transduction histidine kinase